MAFPLIAWGATCVNTRISCRGSHATFIGTCTNAMESTHLCSHQNGNDMVHPSRPVSRGAEKWATEYYSIK